MSNPSNHKMIRVPTAVAERLERMATELLEAYETGRTDRIGLCEQGGKVWVPLHAVITKCLDEYEDHKARSRRTRGKLGDRCTCSRCGNPCKPLERCPVCFPNCPTN